VFASVKAVGHRVVHGMTHSEPKRVAPELLDSALWTSSRKRCRAT
jgi:acetate kinase